MIEYELKQDNEFDYWKKTSPVAEERWYQTYRPLEPYIESCPGSMLDIGCGAWPYSLRFAHHPVTLVDPLMDGYAGLPWTNIADAEQRFRFIDEVPVDARFDIAFVLNCLDHMPRKMAVHLLTRLDAQVEQLICGFVDFRRQPDQYHYVWSDDVLAFLPHFSHVFSKTIDRGQFTGVLFAYQRKP